MCFSSWVCIRSLVLTRASYVHNKTHTHGTRLSSTMCVRDRTAFIMTFTVYYISTITHKTELVVLLTAGITFTGTGLVLVFFWYYDLHMEREGPRSR